MRVSKYTTQLRYLKEINYDLGMNNYPIFDETYREHLNNKIISHYMFYEIGFETPELFKMYLNTRLNEIMPYYNQLYESEKIKFDPLENVNKTTIMDRDVIGNIKNTETNTDNRTYNETKNGTSDRTANTSGTSDGTSQTQQTTTTENNNFTVNSDTPQDLVSFLNLEADKWASSAQRGKTTENTETNSSSTKHESANTDEISHTADSQTTTATDNKIANLQGNQDNNTAEDYTLNIKGKSEGETYSEMILKFRETFLNIDMQIINELKDLFMLIW